MSTSALECRCSATLLLGFSSSRLSVESILTYELDPAALRVLQTKDDVQPRFRRKQCTAVCISWQQAVLPAAARAQSRICRRESTCEQVLRRCSLLGSQAKCSAQLHQHLGNLHDVERARQRSVLATMCSVIHCILHTCCDGDDARVGVDHL